MNSTGSRIEIGELDRVDGQDWWTRPEIVQTIIELDRIDSLREEYRHERKADFIAVNINNHSHHIIYNNTYIINMNFYLILKKCSIVIHHINDFKNDTHDSKNEAVNINNQQVIILYIVQTLVIVNWGIVH